MIFNNFFEEGSPFLSHPSLTRERTLAEIGFFISATGISPGDRILDIGCGFGRHSLELARLGFEAVGIDPSSAMIAEARQRAAGIAAPPKFVCASGETYRTEKPFDAIMCLFTTLGQVQKQADNRRLVDRAYDLLEPGCSFVVEVPQREATLANLKAHERLGTGGKYTLVERSYDRTSGFMNERFVVISGEESHTFRLRYYLFDARELDALLTGAGFAVRAIYGNYDRSPLRPDSSILLAVADKPRRTNGSLRSVTRRD